VIRFSLHCDQAHEFEIWFASNADFDSQAERGLVSCPACGSTHVEKSLMAPAVARTDKARSVPAGSSGPAPVQAPSAPVAMDPARAEMIAAIRDMVRQVRSSAEDVGERFPTEARKIHYGEAQQRGIIGKANPDEARQLLEEGIGVLPLPNLPEDMN
jgi:hypothetical protein